MTTREMPWAIDPLDCGCTECCVGEYVKLGRAKVADVIRLLKGEVSDHSYGNWTVAFDKDGIRISHTDRIWGWEAPSDALSLNEIVVACRIELDWFPERKVY